MISLEAPLEHIRGIGPTSLKKLKKLGIATARDLLWYFPVRYDDLSQIISIAEITPGSHATIHARVENIDSRRAWRKRMTVVEATLADPTGTIKAVWFNQPFLINTLKSGTIANFAGKASMSGGELHLSHPSYEILGRGPAPTDRQADADDFFSQHESAVQSVKAGELKHTGRLVPIYPETRGLTSKGIRTFVHALLETIKKIPEWMPADILKENSFPEINEALHVIHFPAELADQERARRRFAFDDLFLLQLTNLQQRLKLAQEKAPNIPTDISFIKEAIAQLPFTLTKSQKSALWEILKDLEREKPMNRLLQGDVGSGKTAVAALAALAVAHCDFQTAFMAPTEVLAQQHFVTLQKLFKDIDRTHQPSVGLLTSSAAKVLYANDAESVIKKSALIQEIKGGNINVVIGTHALIQKSVMFLKLGLVIVDEQHRFGVKQRASLLHRDPRSPGRSDPLIPHFLSMSATPIPRTVMLTVFGDLDVSLITELPKGRRVIMTRVVPPEKRNAAYGFIRKEVKRGRQVFVICPRIEPPSEEAVRSKYQATSALEVKSVKEEYEKLSQKVFPDLRVGMLHGQLKPKEKDAIMRAFQSHEIDILVSTSVVEVGVDISNATIMMIEGAELFGLAQLYQFRGRVGRGEHQSYCFLFTDSASKSTQERLQAIVRAKNGFELAEIDLKLRGPGEFLGDKQTGLPDIAMDALKDVALIKASREAAAATIKNDPQLARHLRLREKLSEFQNSLHRE